MQKETLKHHFCTRRHFPMKWRFCTSSYFFYLCRNLLLHQFSKQFYTIYLLLIIKFISITVTPNPWLDFKLGDQQLPRIRIQNNKHILIFIIFCNVICYRVATLWVKKSSLSDQKLCWVTLNLPEFFNP